MSSTQLTDLQIDQANQLMSLAMGASCFVKRRGADLFVDWSPHVGAVHVRFFRDGWNRDGQPNKETTIYVDDFIGVKVFNDFLDECIEMVK